MLPRLSAVLIVAFWATMWALLIRTEMRPEGAALREVPVEHVVRRLFQQGRISDLVIESEHVRLGSLRIHPHIREEDGQRLLDLGGSIDASASGAARQRVSWDGAVEFTPELEFETARLRTTVRDAAAARTQPESFELTLQGRERRVRWQWLAQGRVRDERSYTLDEAGLRAAVAEWELDPAMLGSITASLGDAKPARITAQQSTLRIRDELAETLLLTVQRDGQTWLECHISQLGQILQVRTLPGWVLAPERLD